MCGIKRLKDSGNCVVQSSFCSFEEKFWANSPPRIKMKVSIARCVSWCLGLSGDSWAAAGAQPPQLLPILQSGRRSAPPHCRGCGLQRVEPLSNTSCYRPLSAVSPFSALSPVPSLASAPDLLTYAVHWLVNEAALLIISHTLNQLHWFRQVTDIFFQTVVFNHFNHPMIHFIFFTIGRLLKISSVRQRLWMFREWKCKLKLVSAFNIQFSSQ